MLSDIPTQTQTETIVESIVGVIMLVALVWFVRKRMNRKGRK